MRVLLDTHLLLWALADDPKLSSTARSIIIDETNLILYSAASIWEVSIKHSLRPDQMKVSAKDLIAFCDEAELEPLPIANRHVEALETLARPEDAPPHNDPFDRIMLAQAKADDLMFLTHDSRIAEYDEVCILRV